MTSQEINVEMQVENVQETPNSTPQIVKEYHYINKNGKDVRVVRKYNVKYSASCKNQVNKEQLDKYITEHKEELLKVPKIHRATTLSKNVKKDLNLDLSYTGSVSLLKKHDIRN